MLLIDASDELRKMRKQVRMLSGVVAGLAAAVINLKETVMASQAQATQALKSVAEKLDKIATESQGLQDEIQKLKDAAANSDNISPELQDAIDAVTAKAQSVDDKVADAAPAAAQAAGTDTGATGGTGPEAGTSNPGTTAPGGTINPA